MQEIDLPRRRHRSVANHFQATSRCYVEMPDFLHQLLFPPRIDATGNVDRTSLVPWVKVIHDVVRVAEAIMVVFGCPRLSELVHPPLKGQGDAVEGGGGLHGTSSVEDSELVHRSLTRGARKAISTAMIA